MYSSHYYNFSYKMLNIAGSSVMHVVGDVTAVPGRLA